MREIIDPQGVSHQREPIDCRDLIAQGWRYPNASPQPVQEKARPASSSLRTIYDPSGTAHQREPIDCRELMAQGWTMSPTPAVSPSPAVPSVSGEASVSTTATAT